MIRRTKIIATLGPATDEPGNLVQMIQAGVDLENRSEPTPNKNKKREDGKNK